MTLLNQKLSEHFKTPDDMFAWASSAPIGLACMNMALESGLADTVLAAAAPLGALAAEIGVPEDKLRRIVTYLAAHDLLSLSEDGVVGPTPHTALMRDYAACLQISVMRTFAGSQLYAGLREGKTPYEVHFGQPVFEHLAANPELGAVFGDYMGFMTGRVLAFLHANHRFEPFDVAVDVGGSSGELLLSVLEHYPGTRGILFDRSNVLAQAEPRVRASALNDRVELVAGDFFDAVPPADLYLLKQILHDWDDAECARILATIRKAVVPGGRIAVIDHLLSDTPTPSEGLSTDIGMMIWSTGRERTRSEFETLFAESGFRLDRISENPNGHSVIEAVPA